VDSQKISEYLELLSALQGMLKVAEHLFGSVFVEVGREPQGPDQLSARDRLSPTGHGKDLTWHGDVKTYSVCDDGGEGGGFLGYL
jgi:metallopeptidase MepB